MTTDINLTAADWTKIHVYSDTISRRIHAALRRDTGLSLQDVRDVVMDSVLSLLRVYRPGPLSPAAYLYRYLEGYARRDILRETWRRRNTLRLVDLRPSDDDVRSEYGRGDVPALTVDERATQETRDQVQLIFGRATPEDRRIMRAIMEGRTQEDIAAELGISQAAVSKRLKKYAA